ncbi:HD domain-containing protein [Sediminicola luteus]|uniref:Phosphohydrolase n=1 Tax=Sediminicola luteus TaxID=319238 RepID=A0A2A4G6A0_9FLAO|nr:HD domain-containing protein [Sediminicola luteus]PCE63963.1 phosphohydrolase [Sediminicola luteus]
MAKSNKLKIFNDPIYGFIGIPNSFVFDLISEPYFQRLRRITQMGLSYLVYPGAHHTRFHHALGCMHLMRQAIQVLQDKGVEITQEEESGLIAAILLHDIGHGPFSHAMEHSIVQGVQHEAISLKFMQALNEKYKGKLDVAIAMFQGDYPKQYLNQLISSQLDMDRLDYLRRDSFYTGVTEGNVSSQRLISMLNVADGTLVLEEKGIYSVEKFLMARRFMYWQVYLHKTGLVGEQLLIRVFQRARELMQQGQALTCSAPLTYFLRNEVTENTFNASVLDTFAQLDDVDILSALKLWRNESDRVLAKLCGMLLDRQLLHIELRNQPFEPGYAEQMQERVQRGMGLKANEVPYFVFGGSIAQKAYDAAKQRIHILRKDGRLSDVVEASDGFNLKPLSKPISKHYLCYPKEGF